ncbi:hypothetical protein LRS03_22805 [Rhizobacter sp. J219]|nr:hypothetical protein [Rhizobacter sp. J219]MCR5885533.1 hypothetical protein [Rhizobacter sp. J219]
MSMKKHVVFDFGGVVFQWRPKELLKRTLPHRAVDEAAAQQLVLDFFRTTKATGAVSTAARSRCPSWPR